MAVKTFVYSIKEEKWIPKDVISEYDSALFVSEDEESKEKSLYLFEGKNIPQLVRAEARGAIGLLKKDFQSFKLKKIDNTTPKSVIEAVQKALSKKQVAIEKELKLKNRLMIAIRSIGIVTTIISVLVLYFLYSGNIYSTETLNGALLFIFPSNFISTKTYNLSILVLINSILFCITLVFQRYNSDKVGVIFSIGGLFLGFLEIFLYWNNPLFFQSNISLEGIDGDIILNTFFYQFLLLSTAFQTGHIICGVYLSIHKLTFTPSSDPKAVKKAKSATQTKAAKPTKSVTQTKAVKPTKSVTQTKAVKPTKSATKTKEKESSKKSASVKKKSDSK